MNYVLSLTTVMCHGCAAECFPEETHAVHCEMCLTCGEGLAEELAAEQAEADDARCYHANDPREGF